MAKMIEPPYMRHVLTTPLHMNVAAESRTNQWTTWNGYTVPLVLTSLEDEEAALRYRAGMRDISPYFKYRISGADAVRYVARLVTGSTSRLMAGGTMPVVFCEDRGLVVGAGSLFRTGDEEYGLLTEEEHLAWLLDSAQGMKVRVEDVSSRFAGISLQGPLASALLEAIGIEQVPGLQKSGFCEAHVLKSAIRLNRAETDEIPAYQFWMDADDAPIIWTRLMECGEPMGVSATGFMASELMRIEAGALRSGIDYLGAFSAIGAESVSTPFDLGLGHLVDLEHGFFTGSAALLDLVDESAKYTTLRLGIEWPEVLDFGAVLAADKEIGLVTSAAFSPALGMTLALARIKTDEFKGDDLQVTADRRREFSLERLMVPARIID